MSISYSLHFKYSCTAIFYTCWCT